MNPGIRHSDHSARERPRKDTHQPSYCSPKISLLFGSINEFAEPVRFASRCANCISRTDFRDMTSHRRGCASEKKPTLALGESSRKRRCIEMRTPGCPSARLEPHDRQRRKSYRI